MWVLGTNPNNNIKLEEPQPSQEAAIAHIARPLREKPQNAANTQPKPVYHMPLRNFKSARYFQNKTQLLHDRQRLKEIREEVDAMSDGGSLWSETFPDDDPDQPTKSEISNSIDEEQLVSPSPSSKQSETAPALQNVSVVCRISPVVGKEAEKPLPRLQVLGVFRESSAAEVINSICHFEI